MYDMLSTELYFFHSNLISKLLCMSFNPFFILLLFICTSFPHSVLPEVFPCCIFQKKILVQKKYYFKKILFNFFYYCVYLSYFIFNYFAVLFLTSCFKCLDQQSSKLKKIYMEDKRLCIFFKFRNGQKYFYLIQTCYE